MVGVELYLRAYRMALAFPTNDGLTCVAAAWPQSEFDSVRADVEGSHRKVIELSPGLAERMRGGRRAERFQGTGDMTNFFRRPYGPGWVLVGDAGYHKDPSPRRGSATPSATPSC
jgi:hypothetical protein